MLIFDHEQHFVRHGVPDSPPCMLIVGRAACDAPSVLQQSCERSDNQHTDTQALPGGRIHASHAHFPAFIINPGDIWSLLLKDSRWERLYFLTSLHCTSLLFSLGFEKKICLFLQEVQLEKSLRVSCLFGIVWSWCLICIAVEMCSSFAQQRSENNRLWPWLCVFKSRRMTRAEQWNQRWKLQADQHQHQMCHLVVTVTDLCCGVDDEV